mmetsp:Transcript_136147/g.236650  ORF Transcript_136147/g.236650 Transcript_136147/m.236650 type:complete len:580 (+) Transcript_136147:77-1816(+)
MAGIEAMAQLQACVGIGNPNMPLGPPPGLEIPVEDSMAKADVAHRRRELEHPLETQVQAPTGKEEVLTEEMEDIRKSILQHADARLEEKADLLWESAYSELKRLDSQQEKKASDLEEEVRQCHAKLAALEAEKASFQHCLAMMKEQINTMNLAMLNGSGPATHLIPNGSMSPFSVMSPLQQAQGYPTSFATPFPCVPDFPVISPQPLDMVNPAAAAGALAAAALASMATNTEIPSGHPEETTMPAAATPAEPTTTEGSPPAPAAPQQAYTTPVASPAMGPQPNPELPESPRAAGATEISLSEAIDGMQDKKATEAEARGLQSPQPTLRHVEEDTEYETLAATFKSPAPSPSPFGQKRGSRLMGTPSRPKSPQMLGSPKPRTPVRTPSRTAIGMLTPGKSNGICPSPFTLFENGSSIFTFTLRRADDVVLGLDVTHSDAENFLHVKGILTNGAIQAWNRQCSGGPAAGKSVMAGDKIVRVNDAGDVQSMLKQCKEKQLLKITVVRGEPECEINDQWVDQHLASQRRPSFNEAKHVSRDGPLAGAVFGALPPQLQSPCSLRADAANFVPRNTPPPSPQPSA